MHTITRCVCLSALIVGSVLLIDAGGGAAQTVVPEHRRHCMFTRADGSGRDALTFSASEKTFDPAGRLIRAEGAISMTSGGYLICARTIEFDYAARSAKATSDVMIVDPHGNTTRATSVHFDDRNWPLIEAAIALAKKP
jgi:lipopolysaccharide assembly outer membrane protein LptD (OstA)